MKKNKKIEVSKKFEEIDNFCEECKKEDESVSQNLILTGYKICSSCRTSRTLFSLYLTALIGRVFILLITKDIDKKAIIKKDKKTIPKDLKLDFKFRICFVEIIKPAKIQSWVRKIIGIIKSGVTAKNLRIPGAWAKPTPISIFLKGTLFSLSGNNFTPTTNINILHTNHVSIAVKPDIAIAVLIIVLAATAPAIPSNIIINPAK